MAKLSGVVETCLYVDDLDRAADFYGNLLGMLLIDRQEGRHVFFRCGTSMVLLFIAAESSRDGDDLPPHGCHGEGHAAFAVRSEEIAPWKGYLEQQNVEIELDYQWPHGGRSLYFRDPAGNSLEITTPAIWGLPEPE